MAKYNVHAGHCPHNYGAHGAIGILNESNEARTVKNEVIRLLRLEGHTVYDCTCDDNTDAGSCLARIVSKCNQHSVDLDISIHLNSARNDYKGDGSTGGVEVWNYDRRTEAISDRICRRISNELDLKNRGSKYTKRLYVLNNTNSLALLVECCFVDDKDDADRWEPKKCAKAIVEGVLNKTISSTTTPTTPPPRQLYRVRKSWSDEKSQLGAYANLDNAKKNCPVGYSVFNSNGETVYSNNSATQVKHLYRVRKTWGDTKSQLGAYNVLENAKANCPIGYSVFDEEGNVVYANNTKPDTAPEAKPDAKPNIPHGSPDISPLKGITPEAFVEYIGSLAKSDMEKSNILASITIAQAILESSYGQSELSLKANNLFGMKTTLSGNNWESKWDGAKYSKITKEELENGSLVDVVADFRAYKTPMDSIIDHRDYLLGSKNGSELRYKGLAGEKDYRNAIQIIKNGGYATDSGYVDKVCKIVERYGLDKYDNIIGSNDIGNDLNDIKDQVGHISVVVGKIFEILNAIYKFLKTIFKNI